MEREIKVTSDGSKTLHISELNENYHSHHGALQEAEHVFIKNGLNQVENYEINILELGFGTGLNVLVTINEFLKTDKNHKINYFTLEKYPVNDTHISELNYGSLFPDEKINEYYRHIHSCHWNEPVQILPGFTFKKVRADFFDLEELAMPPINLVYYDCFGARVQPNLWEKPLSKIVADKMEIGGLLSTYSAKGSVRRILEELNFKVTKMAGPPGKREMINATKLK